MAKVAIIYASVHHKNTEKLVQGIARKCPVDLYDISRLKNIDPKSYDVIGFASGVYMARPHRSIRRFLDENKEGLKKTFVILTSGIGKGEFSTSFSEELKGKGYEVLGDFECRGYDTFGPFRMLHEHGGGHPNEDDIQRAIDFVQGILEEI